MFYIEKVAVHPNSRHKGIGQQLMEFAIDRIKEAGGQKISIGLINANTKLRKWYLLQNFRETEIKTYDHLPFSVCMMEQTLEE